MCGADGGEEVDQAAVQEADGRSGVMRMIKYNGYRILNSRY